MRFIRKHGHIIPINDSKADPNHNRNVKLYGKGIIANVSGMGVGLLTSAATKPIKTLAQLQVHVNNYKSILSKAGFHRVNADPTLGSQTRFNSRELLRFQGSKLAPKSINLTRDSEAVMAHEVGHAVMSRKKNSANYLARKGIISMGAPLRNPKGPALAKKVGKFVLHNEVRPLANLAIEAEASGWAFKHAFKTGGVKKVAQFSKILVPAYASYVLGAAGASMQSYSIGRGIYDRIRKKKADK